MDTDKSEIENYHRMNPAYLRVLRVQIDQIPFELGDSSQSLGIELLKENLLGRLVFTFVGVQSLRIADIHPGSLCTLQIVPLSERQLENIRYQIFNGEQDLTLSFYCRDFHLSELPRQI